MKPFINLMDVHVRQAGKFAELTDLKLENLAKVFYEWRERAERFVTGGDFFHSPDPSHELLSKCADAAKALGEYIWKWDFIVGNHDPVMRNLSPITAFAKGTQVNGRGMRVITADQTLFDETLKACYCAWSKDKLPVAPANNWLFFGHVVVKDWVKFSDKGFSKKEVEATGFKRYFLGDFHPFFEDGKLVSVGTFGASGFNDEGLPSGYVEAYPDGSFVRHEFRDYPKFKTSNVIVPEIFDDFAFFEYAQEAFENNIVKVNVRGELNEENITNVRRLFERFKPRAIDSINKIYERPDLPVLPKKMLDFSELLARHMNSWPSGAAEMYEQIRQEK